ncbi:8750_t:CDS:2, partial [Entrophospora sp. SA101]
MERKFFLDEPTLYTERKNGKLGSLPELYFTHEVYLLSEVGAAKSSIAQNTLSRCLFYGHERKGVVDYRK